jgi:hypothetical protein
MRPAATLVAFLLFLLPSTAAAQAPCGFALGFKAIADQIPDRVGTCIDDERFNTANGNAEQRTTAHHGQGGLLVWRKADNWTAFTDGHWTWVNGPYGLQRRLNTERFAWERRPIGARFNPARHFDLAAAPSFWLKGDTPMHRDDPVLRARVLDALDTDVAVRHALYYEARRFDRQPIVGIVFGAGDQALQAFVYRPDEGLVYVVEDGIAFAPPPALASALLPLITRPAP